MTTNEIKELVLTSPDYKFLTENVHLGKNILCLGLGGSNAYGTAKPTSDIDIRGVALNTREELILGKDFEQVVDVDTDTTIYSLRKMFELLAKCNPNTIEILGLSDDQYVYTTEAQNEVRKNAHLFLSKRCIATFGGYANSQLRRLKTKSARELGQAQKEKYILGSIKNAGDTFRNNYARREDESLQLYIDKSDKEDFETEIMVDINLQHYPLRDLSNIINDYHSVIRDYDKLGKRNSKAIEHGKLGKHMMHLVRLYYMVFDILEFGQITTYRSMEHDLLMSIRNGEYLESDGVTPKREFYDLLDVLEARLERDKETTKLPDEPDYEAINKLLIRLSEEYILA